MENKNKLFFVFVFFCIVFSACKESKQNKQNTYYVDYVCKNDTMLDLLKKGTSGKVSYYDKENKLQIIPINYMTEDHPDTHYFQVADELPAKPELNTMKYEIIFNESMINDSMAYSFKKYIYTEKGWEARSNMGILKVFNYPSHRDKVLKVVKKRVVANVLKMIVLHTYGK